MAATVHILILAAGASSRMRGADKLVGLIDGKPLLHHVAMAATQTCASVLVTLPPGAKDRRQALHDLPVTLVEVPDAGLGMSRSLVLGVRTVMDGSLDATDGLMILPGDMPGFTAAALAAMIARFQASPDQILRGGTDTGKGGHPAIFPRALWSELLTITGDEGGRSVLDRHRDKVRILPLPGAMARLDLDTPEDWAAYRATLSG
jgi:CTP:molybdopterin cytidylyltransferase MocA